MSTEVEFSGEIHPVAALFPMMTDDELDDLAADIKENGLIHPIVLDASGVLVDGRNRLVGCERAGIEPRYEMLNGQDPVAFILSNNLTRRHMTKGQQAVMLAQIRANAKKIGLNAISGPDVQRLYGIRPDFMSLANVVVRYSDTLTAAVLAGETTLSEAHEKTRPVKTEVDAIDSQSKALKARLEKLRKEAPDLAVLVDDRRLTLDEAFSALADRKRKEEQRIRVVTENLNGALSYLDPGQVDPDESATTFLAADPAVIGGRADFSAERARRCADVLLRYAGLKEKSNNGRPS